METHDPDVYPTVLGGVSRGFLSPFLDSSTPSAIFWHFKTGTFGKSFFLGHPTVDPLQALELLISSF